MAERVIDRKAVHSQLRRLLHRLQADRGAGPWLHAEVARRMAQRLLLMRARPSQIVEWWGALGGSDQLLAETYPTAARIVVEPDAQWAHESRHRRQRPWWSARRWSGGAIQVVDESQPLPLEASQLVWANMVLHASSDPPQLLTRWFEALQVDGFLMFSCLGPDTLKQLRALYASLGWGPIGVDFVDMHDYGDMLVQAGFADPVMDQETLTLTWANPNDLLAELRGLGGNAAPARHPGLRTPRWRRELLQGLEQLRGSDGRLQLSFEVAYGHAFKPVPRRSAAADTSFSLDEMRQLIREPRKLGS
ncbi:MAG: biotin synthase [Ideonella sp.]